MADPQDPGNPASPSGPSWPSSMAAGAGRADVAGMAGPGDMADLVCGIDHVGVAVTDLEGALASYRSLFGARVVHDEVNDGQGVREVMVALGPPDSVAPGPRMQLLVPTRADSPVSTYLRKHGEGVQQVAYRVRDIDRVSDALRRRGIALLYERPQPGTAGSRVNFVHPHDAHGVLVELVEPAEPDTGPDP